MKKLTKKQYRSPIMGAIHQTIDDLHAAGVVDKAILRQFNERCLRQLRQCESAKDPSPSTTGVVRAANR